MAERIPVKRAQALVIGSGAAGLNAAVQLKRRGVNVLIVTEGLKAGTSINTGSDKQTYYKLGLSGAAPDSVEEVAKALFAAGGMHGDLALVEAACSAPAFLSLASLGVRFPQDAYGQFPGYKTDHDPACRATSTGPYTSRDMCLALIREVRRLRIPVREGLSVTDLLVCGPAARRRACGAVALDRAGRWRAFRADHVVLAVGGFGGLYAASVYPAVHTGAIGVALRAGACAQSLPESQFGLASLAFRWNVSGSYMQVVPRVFSTAADGVSDEREFLLDAFTAPAEAYDNLFLKGYQWPFDARKALNGSSRIDLLVHEQCAVLGRRVFLDYRRDGGSFDIAALGDEARRYLERCGATDETPLLRLRRMNPAAVGLYRAHGIDLAAEPLEVAVCAQHNNGGLAANLWWESINVRGLFPVGEVNGSHGVGRPGGAALNAGQVGGMRAAEYIASGCGAGAVSDAEFERSLSDALRESRGYAARCAKAAEPWRVSREEFQRRMTRAGAHLRSEAALAAALREARAQYARLLAEGCGFGRAGELARAFENRQLCFAHVVYLASQLFALRSGVGSRGSALALDADGRALPEGPAFREKVQETRASPDGRVSQRWVQRRPIPETDTWFETAWAAFVRGDRFRAR